MSHLRDKNRKMQSRRTLERSEDTINKLVRTSLIDAVAVAVRHPKTNPKTANDGESRARVGIRDEDLGAAPTIVTVMMVVRGAVETVSTLVDRRVTARKIR